MRHADVLRGARSDPHRKKAVKAIKHKMMFSSAEPEAQTTQWRFKIPLAVL
ncbi:TPA: hypothetical protein ACH3X1_007829 [Trebouxia sp. C0004]